jgi:DNA-binding NtrC family response regulator
VKKRRATAPTAVVLVGDAPDWQPELTLMLASEGYAIDRVSGLDAVLPRLAAGAVRALFLTAGPLSATDLLLVRSIRAFSPDTSVVVVTKTPTDPDLKRAFEDGATAFLSWPASTDAVRHATERATPSSAASRR